MNKLFQYWKKLPGILRNKYLLATVAFVLWMLFFDHNNLFTQFETMKVLRKLNTQRNFYSSEIKNINDTKDALFGNSSKLEQFAREKYLMKKDNEDLFIIEKDTTHN